MTLPGTYAGHPALTWSKPDSFIYLFSRGLSRPSPLPGGGDSSFIFPNIGPGSYKKTVTLNLVDVSPSVSRGELVKIIKAKFSPTVVLSIQYVPVERVQVTFEDSKIKEHVELYDTIDLNAPLLVVGRAP